MKSKSNLLLVALVVLVGCENNTRPSSFDSQKTVKPGIKELTLEGCQYLFMDSGIEFSQNYTMTLTHKGNCTNPIHRCNCTTSPAP